MKVWSLKSLSEKALLVVFSLSLSSCADYTKEFQEHLAESVRARDGESVDVIVGQVKYFSADPLEWSKQRNFGRGEAAFAKLTSDNTCYIVGPEIALSASSGAQLSGEIALPLVYEWPLDVFATFDGCFPVRGEIVPPPVNIINPRLRDGRLPSKR